MLPDKDHDNYNCVVTTDTGVERKVYANWMRNNDLDNWQGWRCAAGVTRFYINSNFDIWSGECENDLLGNVLTKWETKNDTVCQQKHCTGSTDDLIATKYRPK